MKIVYVTSNLHTPDGWVLNIQMYHLWGALRRVAEMGALPLNPHALGLSPQGSFPLREGLLELLGRCDAVLALEGWQGSVFAQQEVEQARQRGIPVFSEGAPAGWDELQKFVRPPSLAG